VHRDLKPGNVMLTKAGARLMDFGLAKPMLAASGGASAPLLSAARTISASPMISPLTTAGTIVGTIQYMSPEQIEGKDADARADIFAFGALLYEMATGKRAFEGKNQISVASAITAAVGSIVRLTTFGCAGNELTCDAFSPPFASPTH
jgi:eukaryotic-like serine/threonine-protein kinase